jgi:UDP-GlcNAc:undecaprenyl-phosphate GlcNAc-1-phosphate transferase
MDGSLFLKPFLVSFVVAVVVLVLLYFLNKKISFNDTRVSKRHIHRNEVSRFGGIALIISFGASILLDDKLVINSSLWIVMFASLLILIFGIIDDVRQLSWKTQLYFQIALILLVYILGIRLEYITNPFGGIFLLHGFWGQLVGLILVVGWILLLINSMNWIDGVDGVSAGVASIGGSAILLLSIRPEVNQPPIGIIVAAFLGGLIGFLLFNFYPAKIMAGTSGSIFMGFLLAILAIFSGAKIATTFLVLIIPIVDAIWVIVERLQSGGSIFSADNRHLHYRLLQIGWSPKKICLFYYVITAVIAVIALNTRALGKVIAFSIVGVVMLGILALIKKKVLQKEV